VVGTYLLLREEMDRKDQDPEIGIASVETCALPGEKLATNVRRANNKGCRLEAGE